MSADKISDALCCDGTLHLHLADGEPRIRYLVDSRTLVFLAEIRNGIPMWKTTWANTDTRLVHNVLFMENLVRKIATDESGWGANLKDFLEYAEMVPDGAISSKIQELND